MDSEGRDGNDNSIGFLAGSEWCMAGFGEETARGILSESNLDAVDGDNLLTKRHIDCGIAMAARGIERIKQVDDGAGTAIDWLFVVCSLNAHGRFDGDGSRL